MTGARGPRPDLDLGVALQRRTYANAAYLASRLPLGLLYFTVLVTMAMLGFSLLSVAVGVVVLAGTLAVAWGFAHFERRLTRWWLGVEIGPISLPAPPGESVWRRVRAHLTSAVTWKSLAFVMLQMPLGIVVFALQTAFVGTAFALFFSPALYLAATLGRPGADQPFNAPLLALSSASNGFQLSGLATAVGLCVAGAGLFLITLHGMNALAAGWGAAARQMLSLSESELRFAEARLQAAAEHARAEQADESRRELVANVSHELRTPIASIQAHVESLTSPEGAPPSPADTQRYLNVIARETERLSSLVDDLLAVAGADAGGLRLTTGPVDIGEVVEQVHSTLAPIARRERRVAVVKSLPEASLPPAFADRDRLLQVLMNLVRNAVAYTAEGGIVSIEAVEDGGRVRVSVSDTGIGIPPEDLRRVFERFYRADASRARSTGGFGLGLSVARDLIEAMKGTITAESEEGVGSRFTVWLVAIPGEAA
jgi:two-component system phosphate regulon sensor histidine kinase PhoR